MGKIIVKCGGCHNSITRPEWNPYDGVWECPYCGETLDIDGGPREVDFDYYNQNPDL